MSASSKPATASGGRRKSSKLSMVIKLKLAPNLLQPFGPLPVVKEVALPKEEPASAPGTLPATPISTTGNALDTKPNTLTVNGTPASSSMPPPTEGVKKKGLKRTSTVALGPDGTPKVRGKPGPKKKPRLEDGSVDHSASAPRAANGTAHKLGPKANQGAINAGLRALDRTGKPCRKWQKGGFKIKSFTGVYWELPRWKAPPKAKIELSTSNSTSGDSSKENKGNSQMESEKSEKSNGVLDIEMASSIPASSPAPIAMPVAPVVEASA